MPRIVIASPHCYPDLARLWYRTLNRVLVPALSHAQFEVEVVIFCDANIEQFNPEYFPSAILQAPDARARDFLEFYDAILERESDFLFLLDADMFFLDGGWPAAYLASFDDPDVAGVSFLRRAELPGVIYAFLCRTAHYRGLPSPVFTPMYENIENWPDVIHREPGEYAAMQLQAQGKQIIQADSKADALPLADFHGTTNLRVSRERFGVVIGAAAFEDLIARQAYFACGAYDNILLGALYETLFGERFAPDSRGEALAGSVTIEAFERILACIQDPELQQTLSTYFNRSKRAIMAVAEHEGVALTLPDVAFHTWG